MAYVDASVYVSANDARDAHTHKPIQRTASDEYVESIETIRRSAAAPADGAGGFGVEGGEESLFETEDEADSDASDLDV